MGGAAFNPMDKTMVVSVGSNDIEGLFLIDYRGKALKWLRGEPKGDYYVSRPSYSPDGKLIAFHSNTASKNGDIFVMNSDGHNVRRLTNNPQHNRDPRFSPDGRRIYFCRSKWWGNTRFKERPTHHENDIFFIDLDDNNEYRLTNNIYFTVFNFSLLQGDKIAISTPEYLEQCQMLWEIDLHNPRHLRPFIIDMSRFSSILNYDPGRCKSYLLRIKEMVSSINGRHLVFQWGRDAEKGDKSMPYYLYALDMQTGQTRLAAPHASAFPKAVSNDGKRILFVGQPVKDTPGPIKPSHIWMVDYPGAKPRRLTLDFTEVMREGPVGQ